MTSCGEEKNKNTDKDTTSVSNTKTDSDVTDTTQSETSITDDGFTEPLALVEELFAVAESGEFKKLAGMCDPEGKNDKDTRRICELADGKEKRKKEFVKYFTNASVDGDPIIEGEEAKVNILFGPNGEKKETLNLVQREGKWYLSSF